MTSVKRHTTISVAVCWFACCAFVARAQDSQRFDDATIVGRWTTKANSKNGPIKLVKEHGNGITTLTAYDATGRVLYGKSSEYHTEKQGNVKVFVFTKSRYTAGPDAGKTDNRTQAYIYRVDQKRFFEVRGMMTDSDESPAIIVWDRLNASES